MIAPTPYDPELAVVLPAVRARMPDPRGERFVAGLREMALAGRPSKDDLRCGGQVEIRQLDLPGGDLGVLLLRPAATVRASLPAVVFLHSGGMIAGDRWTGAGLLVELVCRVGVCAVSVDYRLAPEHPYPAGVEDACAALTWVVENADELGVDPGRVVLAGASGGAGLAAGCALMVRDRGGPAVAGQLLLSAMLDDRNNTPSSREFADGGTWSRTANALAWAGVLGNAAGDVPGYAAPARATDLRGLPPAFLDVGSAELFRDEVVEYARRLWHAGNPAELHVWPGGFHGFDWTVPGAALSVAAKGARVRWLRRVLETPDRETAGDG